MLRKIALNKKKLKIVFLIFIFVFILAGWAAKHYVFPHLGIKGQVVGSENQKDQAYYSDLYNSDSGDVISEDDPYSALILKNKYTVTGVSVEHEITSEERSAMQYSTVDLNDAMNYCIVCVSLEIENQREREELILPNSNKIKIMSGDSSITTEDPFLMKPYKYSPSNSQHFHLTIQPEETVQIQLYYCIKDEYLNDEYTLQFYLNPSGLNEQYVPNPNDDSAKYFAKMNLNTFISE